MNKKYLKYEQQKCSLYYSFRVFYIIITDVKSIFILQLLEVELSYLLFYIL